MLLMLLYFSHIFIPFSVTYDYVSIKRWSPSPSDQEKYDFKGGTHKTEAFIKHGNLF